MRIHYVIWNKKKILIIMCSYNIINDLYKIIIDMVLYTTQNIE